MHFLVFLGVCVAVAAGYESLEISDEFARPESSSEEFEESYGEVHPMPLPQYNGGSFPSQLPEFKPIPPLPGYGEIPNYNNFRKLKTLRGDNIVKAKLRYYKKDNQNFVVISCPRNPTPGAYTWILADSKHRATPSFGLPDTVALAAGLNVEFIAKLNQHQKWEGRDMTNDDKHRFRRVGCFHGATQSFIKN